MNREVHVRFREGVGVKFPGLLDSPVLGHASRNDLVLFTPLFLRTPS